MRWLPVVPVLALVLSGCASDPGGTEPGALAISQLPDPSAAGELEVEQWHFELQPRIVNGLGTVSPYIVTPEGVVHAPKPGAGGPYPLVVLMHGRHGTCDLAGGAVEFLVFPCPDAPPATAPVDSFTGYDYLAASLASHGYVVASISANHVNDRDNDYSFAGDDAGATARANLLLSFLDDVRDVQAGAGPEPLRALQGRVDLSSVGAMGHSRGGEGVVRAAVLNQERAEPHALRAVFALAPTDFDRHVLTGVPLAVLLPYCDGDVSNLQGAWMVDDASAAGAGPLHQVLATGANHNWYNTVWTGSDWGNRGDPHCDLDPEGSVPSGRDSEEEQRAHGLSVMSAFFRAYVGGEAGFLPFLTGQAPFAEPGLHVTYWPTPDGRLDLPTARREGFARAEECDGLADCPIVRTYSAARQTYLNWTSDATLTFPLGGLDASGHDRLALRIGFDHGNADAGASPVRATLVDASGREASADLQGALFHPPGELGAKTTLNGAWADLGAFEGVDLARLDRVELTFTGRGAAQVAEPMFQALP